MGSTGTTNGTTSSALCDVKTFIEHTFDFVIIGGGTAGLVLANRLSENANVKVGVLEAGPAQLNDPIVLTPGAATQGMYRAETNWMMKSRAQVRDVSLCEAH